MKYTTILQSLLFAFSIHLTAQPPQLVADYSLGAAGTFKEGNYDVASLSPTQLIFTLENEDHGEELGISWCRT